MRTMCWRWLITCIPMLLINKAMSLERKIEAVEGGTIILPCSYSVDAVKTEEVKVYWRYNNNRKVYNIVGNVPVKGQDQEYEGRTESFPDEFANGNFSIRLSSVKASDQGTYSCAALFTDIDQNIHLQVKAPQPTTTQKPAPKTTPKSKSNGAESRSVMISSLSFTVLLGFSNVLL